MSTSSTSSSTSSSAYNSLLSSLANVDSTTASASTTGSLITAGQINVSTLVSELMAIQEQPLTELETQASSIQSKLSAYGQLQSSLSSMQTAAEALALPSAFSAAAATVTGSGASASVTGEPADGTYSVDVSSLATAQTVVSSSVASSSTAVGTGTLTLQLGTVSNGSFSAGSSSPISVTIDSSNDTLSGIASAINSAAGGSVTASVVTNADGTQRLVLASANSGSANAFTVTGTSSLSQFDFDPSASGTQGMTQTQAGADAQFSVNGVSMTSATNSVTTAISGVTLNLTQAPTSSSSPLQSQVTIATDPSAVTSTVQTFVNAYNSLVSQINSLTSYNTSTSTASELTGDSATASIASTLQGILGSQTTASGTTSTTSWLAEVGISFNSDGTLSLNTTQFQDALQSNPSGVSAMFTASGSGSSAGFAVQVDNAVTQLLGSTGALGASQNSLESQLTYINTQETSMQTELAQKQTELTQEYSALNAALSSASEEQTSLSSELAGLPG